MMTARVPSVRVPTPFLDLVGDRTVAKHVANSLHRIVSDSFARNRYPMRGNITVAEVRRRSKICLHIARQIRNDLQWGWQRILDQLPEYLDCELDGKTWEPDKRAIWVPGDGR